MRNVCFAFVFLALPIAAAAQQGFSLPSIGLPLPSIGLQGQWPQRTPWEYPLAPAWERREVPPWEQRPIAPPRLNDRDVWRHRGYAPVYYIPYAIGMPQQPQIIVVQQPPVTRIVQIEAPAPPRTEPPPQIAEPPAAPNVPSGDRTLYVIPGCYVGNVSPVNLKLPPSCDLTKLTTYVP